MPKPKSKSKSKSEDCNCYYTGFHPRFGLLPKKKIEESAASAQINPSWNRANAASGGQNKTKATKTQARPAAQLNSKTASQSKAKSRQSAK
ncbi:MAG TPA: hypothetical protein V6C86_26935 [Oculatellaceae cyanobacterium]